MVIFKFCRVYLLYCTQFDPSIPQHFGKINFPLKRFFDANTFRLFNLFAAVRQGEKIILMRTKNIDTIFEEKSERKETNKDEVEERENGHGSGKGKG